MKFYNFTDVPDSILRPIIAGAGVRIGACGANTVVRVTAKRNVWGIAGVTYNWKSVPGGKLRVKRKWLRADRYIELTIPTSLYGWEWLPQSKRETFVLRMAEQLWKIALHEWAHVRDYQYGDLPGPKGSSYQFGSTRRMAWRKRPVEVRANNATDAALAKTTPAAVQDAILGYALLLLERG